MEVQDYCENMAGELTTWKAKVYDTVRRIDKMPTGDKAKLMDQVNDLHILIEEIDDRIGRLKSECPVNWEPDKIELEGRLTKVKTLWGNLTSAAQD